MKHRDLTEVLFHEWEEAKHFYPGKRGATVASLKKQGVRKSRHVGKTECRKAKSAAEADDQSEARNP